MVEVGSIIPCGARGWFGLLGRTSSISSSGVAFDVHGRDGAVKAKSGLPMNLLRLGSTAELEAIRKT